MALAFVLWAVGLLSILGMSLLYSGEQSYRLAHSSFETARAEAIMDAALNRAVLALVDPRPQQRWRVDGIPQEFTFDGISAKVTIQDEVGRIDINQADGSILNRLLVSVGVPTSMASKLVDKILDWRDASPAKRLNGAKAAEYKAAGRSYTPRNGPFQSIDELLLVLDMTPELYARIRPAVTVYAGRPNVDPQHAPPQVLRVLLQDAAAVRTTLTARTMRGSGLIPPSTPIRGRAFTILTEVMTPRGVLAREIAIRIIDQPDRPYWVLHRRT